MLSESNQWKEVNKNNPCSLCDRTSWCYRSDSGSAIVCGRTDANKVPLGWKYLKDASDGRAIFVTEDDKPSNLTVKQKTSKNQPLLSHPPKKITLATLPAIVNDRPLPKSNQIPQWLIAQGVPVHATETRYFYSKTQWVSRFEWKDTSHPKGHDKTIRQGHNKLNGQPKWSKGEAEWLPYRFEEAVNNAKGKWLLAVEGEESVEVARSLGLAAITWQGSSWGESTIAAHLQQLKEKGILGIVKFRDNDAEGKEKAKKLTLAGQKADLPIIILDPNDIWADIPDKGDLVDWVTWGTQQGMKANDFIACLEQCASQSEQLQPKTEPTATDRLKLEIQAYLQSADIFDKVRLKGQICSTYRISNRDFELLCQALEKKNSTPKANSSLFC
ncbi:hypothetical protein C7H19_25040 [Aphanothece hegewaldii CCALA 016]|uniref:Toprim domain-containing protein n=1 Tax=Aphanothece hegewaldii CCALA 016 TaxID=2107694 RepID=A0A2T1LQC1_9CHRO|nr:hypothetical protein [Aphanothece hegewaldii]PSF27080.1 hypothetical protein C7H19_25040 [Aphanothece hegewaldii CCALA 016]